MATELAALKVKIELNTQGHAKYPLFNTLACVLAANMDWSQYIDRFGSGWLYDSIGHQEEDADSPRGQQWGLLLVPEDFADQAVVAFPTLCSRLTDAQAKDFYEKRHAKDVPEEEIDLEILQQIKAKQDLGIALTQQERRAIDPRDEERGVRPNRRKTFATFSADRGFSVKNKAT